MSYGKTIDDTVQLMRRLNEVPRRLLQRQCLRWYSTRMDVDGNIDGDTKGWWCRGGRGRGDEGRFWYRYCQSREIVLECILLLERVIMAVRLRGCVDET